MGRTRILSRRFIRVQLLLLAALFTFAPAAGADAGPKASLTIYASNMPPVCYLDLLIEDEKPSGYTNLRDEAHYDPVMLKALRDYNVDGWRPAYVTGTWAPLWGDIVCDVEGGNATVEFRYFGVPDRFKIIVVTPDGKTVVSNIVERNTLQYSVSFDYAGGEAAGPRSVANAAGPRGVAEAVALQFLFTCLCTLVLEGLTLLLFRFKLKLNWKPFLIINVSTQVVLSAVLALAYSLAGGTLALIAYIVLEIFIFITETVLFTFFLREHSKLRRAMFSLTANALSFLAGIFLVARTLMI